MPFIGPAAWKRSRKLETLGAFLAFENRFAPEMMVPAVIVKDSSFGVSYIHFEVEQCSNIFFVVNKGSIIHPSSWQTCIQNRINMSR